MDVRAIRGTQATAHVIAEQTEWTPLYDAEVLSNQRVPVVGTVYYEDLYVDRGFALETVQMLPNAVS